MDYYVIEFGGTVCIGMRVCIGTNVRIYELGKKSEVS